jgi:hypothetical protein
MAWPAILGDHGTRDHNERENGVKKHKLIMMRLAHGPAFNGSFVVQLGSLPIELAVGQGLLVRTLRPFVAAVQMADFGVSFNTERAYYVTVSGTLFNRILAPIQRLRAPPVPV